jgi:hypothetical protein
MPIETIALFLTLFFTAISLILTIIGWKKTYDYQRKILERQIDAEKEKELRQLIVSRKIEQIRQITDWVTSGHSLWVEWLNRPKQLHLKSKDEQEKREAIDRKITNWKSIKYQPIYAIIASIEELDKLAIAAIPKDEYPESLAEMISNILGAMPAINSNPHYYDENHMWSLEKSIDWDNSYPKILRRLEFLKDLVLAGKNS